MNRVVLRVKLLLILLTLSAIVILPSPAGKAQCNGQCGKVRGSPACIRAFNSTGDPIDIGTDCFFLNGSCLNTQCA
jgi:hypothetical protein